MAELIVTSSLDQIDKYKFCNIAQLRSIIKCINKPKLTGEIVFPKDGTILFTDVDTHAVIDVCRDYNELQQGVTHDKPILGSKEI
jgi:hypothetical protein